MATQDLQTRIGRVILVEAWTDVQIGEQIRALLTALGHRLPESLDARIVLKPNLNNDLVALTGNCTDLRVLAHICEALQERGYTAITIADGSNVGVERRGINAMGRLRVDKLAERLGVGLVDLNKDQGRPVSLHAGAHPRVAQTILDADCLISVPTLKTHVEMGLSCALKNWVGICTGQDKRHMHYDLGRNIFALGEIVVPDLIIVDGLVGMEGNGPGDGDPFRLGHLIASDSMHLCDVAACRLVGLPVADVPYLVHAEAAGRFDAALVAEVAASIPQVHQIKPAPERSRLAVLSEARSLGWLKKLARPLTDDKRVLEAAYRLGVIQDVYDLEDDGVRGIVRNKELCGECEKCADFCPTHLPLADIGVKTDMPDCIGCMYCWWVCPKDAISLDGPPQAMTRQIGRYKGAIEELS
jgi:uncharacterized protein (DUF362 family)/Pyruvate/2-oxoacid:ferredoxin oxidoreductase delta subunit